MKEKKGPRWLKVVIGFFLCFVIAIGFVIGSIGGDDDEPAPLRWAELEAEAAQIATRRDAEAPRKREEQEAEACRQDLQCLGDKFAIAARVYCKEHIEDLGEYAHEWTDGLLEYKFPAFSWSDKPNGIVRYHGDSIQFQTGSGRG